MLTLYLPVYIPDNGINVTDDNAVTEGILPVVCALNPRLVSARRSHPAD